MNVRLERMDKLLAVRETACRVRDACVSRAYARVARARADWIVQRPYVRVGPRAREFEGGKREHSECV